MFGLILTFVCLIPVAMNDFVVVVKGAITEIKLYHFQSDTVPSLSVAQAGRTSYASLLRCVAFNRI